jgi:hypothetical protein
VTTDGALGAFRPITSSVQDTCQTQREVAEHNSRYDTLRTGKEVAYKAPCDLAPAAKVAKAPPTS